jgi:hypothetical protein
MEIFCIYHEVAIATLMLPGLNELLDTSFQIIVSYRQ